MRVRVVGAGLLGASVGMALTRAGHHVHLSDVSPTAMALARDLGAGSLEPSAPPQVVVVATPPDVAGAVIAQELIAHPEAVVTDVSSVKAAVLADVRARVGTEQLGRYIGSHPMAGAERSGAIAARADLFEGRSWVLCPHPASAPHAVQTIAELAEFTGAAVTRMPPEDHDRAVAAVSHLPQLAASLVAARLRDLSEDAVGLAGQGVRDVTRIAASDPMLWTQILAGNADALLPVLEALESDLARVREAMIVLGKDPDGDGARAVLASAIADGQQGHARIPGKHGAPPTAYAQLIVVLPDEPGQLGRLFTDVGGAGVNLEDVRIDHAAGKPVGLAELSVLPASAERLWEYLTERGWRLHS